MTHIHVDHVGYNTRLLDGTWVPTFPKGRYYFFGIEADYNAAIDSNGDQAASELRRQAALGLMRHPPAAGIYTDSIQPIEAAGLTERIVMNGTEVIPGFTYLSLPGHSIDRAGIILQSASEQALFWGDVLHHPVQLSHPDRHSTFCAFPEAAIFARGGCPTYPI